MTSGVATPPAGGRRGQESGRASVGERLRWSRDTFYQMGVERLLWLGGAGVYAAFTTLLPKELHSSTPAVLGLSALALLFTAAALRRVWPAGDLAREAREALVTQGRRRRDVLLLVFLLVALPVGFGVLVLPRGDGLSAFALHAEGAILPLVTSALFLEPLRPPVWRGRRARLVTVCTMLGGLGFLWLRGLWAGADESWPWSRLVLHGVAAACAMVYIGILASLQIWESAIRPEPTEAELGTCRDLWKEEAPWLSTRRRAVGLAEGPSPGDPRPPGLVGLALSGGGIRSATLCLGVLRGLAERRPRFARPLLAHVDYLGTVSGGGWAGGAFTTRMADDAGEFDPARKSHWKTLTAQLRRRGDYLVPGGIGLTVNTARPIVIVVVGALLNALVLFCAAVAGLFLLRYGSCHTASAEAWLRTSLVGAFSGGPFDRLFLHAPAGAPLRGCPAVFSGRLEEEMQILNWLCVGFVAALAAIAAGALCMTSGVIATSTKLHRAGVALCAWGIVLGVPLGLLLLGVHKRFELTLLGAGALLALPVLTLLRRLTRTQIAAAFGALFAGQSTLLTGNEWLKHHMDDLTSAWAGVFHGVLLLPARWTPGLGTAGHQAQDRATLLTFGLGSAAAILLGFFVGRNQTSPHGFWADQIRRAYLRNADDGATGGPSDWPIAALRPAPHQDRGGDTVSPRDPRPWNVGGAHRGAPLPVITGAVNTPASPDNTLRKRGTARFEISPYAVGGPATGWAAAHRYGASITLSQAIAVSSAAVNSQGGKAVPRWARFLLMAANVSLGYWFRNPALAVNRFLPPEVAPPDRDLRFRRWGHFWIGFALGEVLARNSERDTLILASDGGHHDNLGLTTLVDRACKLVLCVDATSDPGYLFDGLTRTAQLLAIDGGWSLDIDISGARPEAAADGKPRLVKSPVRVGTLRRWADGKEEIITLVHIKAAVDEGAPFVVRRYAEAEPTFPHQSTAEQFFGESQFEAYSQLGEHLAGRVAEALEGTPAWEHVLAEATLPG
jgi:hypothetical protein